MCRPGAPRLRDRSAQLALPGRRNRHRGRDGECWAFVEVKTRRGRAAGLPEEALTPRKAAHLTAAAEAYLADHELAGVTWRLDLVAIELDGRGAVRRLDVLPAVGGL